MAGPLFTVGEASGVASGLVAGGLAAYGLAATVVAARGFRRALADRWSTLACGVVLLACAVAMLRWGAAIVPAPFGPFALAALVVGTCYATLFARLRIQAAMDWSRAGLDRMIRMPRPDLPHEERRKLPHLAMGLHALAYVGAGHAVLVVAALVAAPVGMPDEAWTNLLAVRDAPWAVGGEAVQLSALLVLVLILAPIELVRLASPESSYPWKRIIAPLLRPREEGLLGGHLHMAAGVLFAALLLGRDPAHWDTAATATMAVILVAVFADAVSAIVGLRLGRTKWRHNPGKSHVGTIGGTTAAFMLALPFVGLPLAAATAAWFLAVDLAAPVPIPISDNLLNPIGLAVIYVAWPDLVRPFVGLP